MDELSKFQRFLANQSSSSGELFNCKGVRVNNDGPNDSLQKLIDENCKYYNFLVDHYAADIPEFRRRLQDDDIEESVPPVMPSRQKFLDDRNYADISQNVELDNQTPWHSTFSAFFNSSDNLIDIDEPEKVEEDHFLLLMKSIRGERYGKIAETNSDCPSLAQFVEDDDLRHAPNDFFYRNRNVKTMNMVFLNEYEMDKDQSLYNFFLRKYIYNNVIYFYWLPISCISVILSLIITSFLLCFVNIEVLRPIQDMSKITEKLLDPENENK